MKITDDSVLERVEIDMLSRTFYLHGYDGEFLEVHESSALGFANMCTFVNNTLPPERITYKY
jgi:hypothetical protein